MFFLHNFRQIQLDIVGIVAILGEGSVARNAQVSALTWHHVFPRLLPAPQALIKHERATRLPTQLGTVIGAYSGNLRFELNFFAALIHTDEMEKNQVKLVKVSKKKDAQGNDIGDKIPYNSKGHGHLLFLSLLGSFISAILLWLSVHQVDGFALLATILLSLTSTVVGLASWWTLDLEEETTKIAKQEKGGEEPKKKVIPDGDVVIHYPRVGAFLIVRCESDTISRLYFRIEGCRYTLGPRMYRAFAFSATGLLIAGLICLGNSKPILQIAFAASYVLLNLAYWVSSALDPVKHHWQHNYDVTEVPVEMPARKVPVKSSPQLEAEQLTKINEDVTITDGLHRTLSPQARTDTNELEKASRPGPLRRRSTVTNVLRKFTTRSAPKPEEPVLTKSELIYTDALWTAIALVGHARWLEGTSIAPNNKAWRQWCSEAGKNAIPDWDTATSDPTSDPKTAGDQILTGFRNEKDEVVLPPWDHRGRIRELLQKQPARDKGAPSWPKIEDLKRKNLIGRLKTSAEQQPRQFADVAIAITKLESVRKAEKARKDEETARQRALIKEILKEMKEEEDGNQ